MRVSRRAYVAGLLIAFLPGVGAAPAADTSGSESDAQAIVEKADRIRFPSGGFQVDVTIVSTSPGRDPDVREYRVLSKGPENSVVLTTAPAAERGNVLLMKGVDLWAFLPSVSQPVRLPLSQRLTGQVANGDLARANFGGDYKASTATPVTVDGEPHHLIELTASRRGVTYDRVRYWVNVGNGRPHKAEFYSKSGRLLKTCLYEDYRSVGGAIRPARLVMLDALKRGEKSVLEYKDMVSRDLPDRVFTKEYLKKLQ